MPQRPNVLLLFSDQHRADVLGCEDHPDVETPHLDALAASGTRFSRAYCQDGVCVPSRSSLLAGLYPRTLGCLDNGDRSPVMDRVVPLQESFRRVGYRTGAFGKRHVFQACDQGWDVCYGHLAEESAESYVTWVKAQGYEREFARDWAAEWGGSHPEGPALAKEFAPARLSAQATMLPAAATMEAYTTDRTIEFLRQNAGGNFFCWSSFYRPHQPYTPLPQYLARYDLSHWGAGMRKGDGIALPPAFRQPPEDLPPMLRARRAVKGDPWCLHTAHEEEAVFRYACAAYYASVLEIDDCTGRILAELDRLGLRENTIVVYTADHGEFAGGHGIMEKIAQGHNVYEDTLRVPLIVSWPGHYRAGVASDALAELVDLYPTLRTVCGLPEPEMEWRLAGRDLNAHLARGEAIDRKHAFSENWSQVAVIGERYKLGHWLPAEVDPHRDFRAAGDQLFDRQNDPAECSNVLTAPPGTTRATEAAAAARELLTAYKEWSAQTPADGKDLHIARLTTKP